MLPFQTDTFDPGNGELIQRVQGGERVTWLYLGATVYLVDGERWIVVSGGDYLKSGPTRLAYPLAGSYGADHVEAVKTFEKVLRKESVRIHQLATAANASPEQASPPRSAPAAPGPSAKPTRKAPRGRPVALAGAVPLPGLEPWNGFGRQG